MSDTCLVLFPMAVDARPRVVGPAGADRTVLAVPGEHVHVAWLTLPARNAVQARAAAQALLAERLATPADTLHVAVAGTGEADGLRLVAAVERAMLEQWLDRAAKSGYVPDAVVPDCLLLPAPHGDRTCVVVDGDRRLVRGERLAFTANAALADAVLGERPCRVLDRDAGDVLLFDGARAPVLDLADRLGAAAQDGRSRRLRRLAAAVLVAPLLLPAATAARHAWSAHMLESTARAEAALALRTSVADPLAETDARLAGLTHADALPRALSGLAAAIDAHPGLQLDALSAGVDGTVASVVHGDAADLAALDAALGERGIALAVVAEGSAADGRRRTDLQLEPMP